METVDLRRFRYYLLRLQEQGVVEKLVVPEGYVPAPYPAGYFCGQVARASR